MPKTMSGMFVISVLLISSPDVYPRAFDTPRLVLSRITCARVRRSWVSMTTKHVAITKTKQIVSIASIIESIDSDMNVSKRMN